MIEFNFFSNNTILSWFFRFLFLFIFINLYFLITALLTKNFIPTAELAISRETATNEGNAESETQPLTSETKKRKFWK